MAEIYTLHSSQDQFEDLLKRAELLPGDLKAKMVLHLSTSIVYELPENSELSLDGVIKFARSASRMATARISESRPEPNAADLAKAAAVLSLPRRLTGPERALAAAIKLYHDRKPIVNARVINTTNDSHKGAFISNITSAINSNLKEGLLEEIAGESGRTEGHSSYSVTPKGFAFFNVVLHRVQAQLPAIGEDLNSSSDAA